MKWIIGVIVVIIVAIGLWWSGLINSFIPQPAAQQATTTPETTQQPPAQPQAVNDLPTQPNDASDAAMAQDAAAVDAQMSSLNGDSSNIDSSLNDKAGAQEF